MIENAQTSNAYTRQLGIKFCPECGAKLLQLLQPLQKHCHECGEQLGKYAVSYDQQSNRYIQR